MRRLSILVVAAAALGALALAPAAQATPGVDSCANADQHGQPGIAIAAGLCLYTQ